MIMAERFGNLLDGKWVESANAATFEDINPANKADSLGSFPRSDHRDVDRAVEVARGYFGTWARVPPSRRADILYAAARIIEIRAAELSALIVRETGKVLREAQLELRDALSSLRAIAAEGARISGDLVVGQPPEAIVMALPAPLGVAGVVAHWTFSFAVCVRAVASALTAGNTVVLKPAEDAPLAAVRLMEILLEAGQPPGSISLVHGQGEEAGAPLVRHPDVPLVCFTGSADVGREVAIACAAEQKHLVLDVGERFAALVLDDADLDLAVEGVVVAAFACAGQRWRGAARLYVQRKVLKDFSERLTARAQALRLGDGMTPTTEVGPVINEAQLKRVHSSTRIGLRDGAKLLCGGEAVKEGDCRKGFFYAPTVFGEAAAKMRLMKEDVVGPTLALLSVASAEDAVEQLNAGRPPEATAVYTGDIPRGVRLIETVRAKRVHLNPTPGSPGTAERVTGCDRFLTRMPHRADARDLLTFGFWKTATIDTVARRQ